MPTKPLVSVYIATHNRSLLLKRALDSVIAQTYPNIEIIVADDGSTDSTLDILLPYINKKLIIYVKNKIPKGACVARNLAINTAKGEFITGLDDDDEFTPDRVEHMVNVFNSGVYSCVASPYTEKTPKGRIDRTLDSGEVSLDKLLHANILGNQILTKTNYLKEIGGFDPNMLAFQDYDTWVRLVCEFGVAYKSKKITYIWYTDHESGRISQSSEKRINAFSFFIKKHKHLMSKKHEQSMIILNKRLKADNYSVVEFFKLTNSSNIKSSFSYFLNRNLKALKWFFDKLRLVRK